MNSETAVTQLVKAIRLKHYSLDTERTYVGWLRRFIAFTKRDNLAKTSEQRFERFLTQLALDGVSASTQNQAFNAILFFYQEVLKQPLQNVKALRATRPARLRHAPSKQDVAAMFSKIEDIGGYPTRLITALIYGCGLRVNEPLNLRLKDVELHASRLIIREAKGGKDRVVSIPCSLMPAMQAQLKLAEAAWMRDQANSLPVPLPGLLGKKYPKWAVSKGWYWLFPALGTCPHPRTGQTVRWRCHEANIQRSVRRAVEGAGITTPFTPHHLRHAFATHAMEAGMMVRDIQAVMGHANLETTAGYLHPEAERVASPLDSMIGSILALKTSSNISTRAINCEEAHVSMKE